VVEELIESETFPAEDVHRSEVGWRGVSVIEYPCLIYRARPLREVVKLLNPLIKITRFLAPHHPPKIPNQKSRSQDVR
jgi:hypothetical protein